ncbi:MAG: tRNA 2-thiouridine(34) synthase MnmA [Candidatus Spechtbacteria bacterium]|nr:tRNA 2-thiouridine(34) synthase MnmA [Candidatus Spechtbacteria bacterium]
MCAMSGGVDSAVSAALLKKAGFDVAGVFMKCWSEDEVRTGVCTAEEDEMWARRAAAKIGIPFYSVDLVKEYKKRVVEYFVREYKAGRTPNPDVMCNKEIKFGMFYDMAMKEFTADYVATGHYARIVPFSLRRRRARGEVVKLLKGKDPNKDQSYFLWAVAREKFKNILFPVGGYVKPKVRMLAREFGLPNAERKDSQGICFIGKVRVGNFLRNYIDDKPGEIMNQNGEKVGAHEGLHFYTVGQRKGINIGGGPPYYVAQKNYAENTLLVVREYDDALFQKSLCASSLNWISKKPCFPYRCKVKIRYRDADRDAIIKKEDFDGNLNIEFNDPQRAVTPGQSIVFYQGDELLGGGIIL